MFYTDQLGRTITLEAVPQRIISLVPSQTELLFSLGLGDKIVGVTKFCIHPDEALVTKSKIGGTKNLNFETIRQLKPDLIIGNKEENEQAQIQELMKEYPVWMSDICNLSDALEMIRGIGEITHEKTKANEMAKDIYKAFLSLTFANTYCAAYFIWRNPYMVAGGETFLQDMTSRCGFVNVFAGQVRYPEINTQDLKAAAPEVILLSSEPYPFSEKHIAELQGVCHGARILLVDGEMFSWYGSRLLQAPAYFKKLINCIESNKI